MRDFIINNRNITELFIKMNDENMEEILVSTDTYDDKIHMEDYAWSPIVELGVKKIVLEHFGFEYSLINYHEVTMACIRYDVYDKYGNNTQEEYIIKRI